MSQAKSYRQKTVVSGNQVEYYEHEFPVIYGRQGTRGGRKPGGGSTQRYEEYRKRSTIRAKHDLIRLINANFQQDAEESADYKFITLTFRDGAIPDLADVKRANEELKKYCRKLRGVCRRAGKELRYVSVIEFQDHHKRGAVHFHLIVDVPVIPVTKEKAVEWIQEGKLPPDYKAKINHHDLWSHGSVTVKAIHVSEREWETGTVIETRNIGEYVTGYMVKEMGDPRLRGLKAYSPSQGLRKPQVLYNEEAVQAVAGIEQEKVVCEDCYLDTYHRSRVYYRKINKV